MSGGAGRIVWTRQVDEVAAGRRWGRFTRWYVAPAAAVAVAALVLGGFGPMLGVLILVGGFGALLAAWIWLYDRGLASNPELRLVDATLVQGSTAVVVDDIEAWSTAHTSATARLRRSLVPRFDPLLGFYMPGPWGSGPSAVAVFRVPVMRNGERGVRPDGGPAYRIVRFAWAEMTEAEVHGLRETLESLIPAPWVDLDRLGA